MTQITVVPLAPSVCSSKMLSKSDILASLAVIGLLSLTLAGNTQGVCNDGEDESNGVVIRVAAGMTFDVSRSVQSGGAHVIR
jgi:hypothetical protein